MGLQIDKVLENGLSVNNVYARIDSIMGSKIGLDFSVNYYASREAFLSGKPYLQQEMYKFTPSVSRDSKNFIQQGYIYLKTLEQFKNSSDVLEEGQA